MNRRTFALMIAILAVLSVPSPAFAHSAGKRFGEFYGGMLHPLTALEHLLPMIALSLFAGQHGPKLARWCLIAFPAGLLIGVITASTGSPSPFVTTFNLASFVVLGVLVAGSLRQPLIGLVGLAVVFGFSHGYENVAAIDNNTALHLFAGGIALSGLFLMAIPAAVVVSLRHHWQQIVVRVIGSWIAAIGVMMLALR